MAWQTPKINWSDSDLCTHEDANRIAGNINFLAPGQNLKANYTQADFWTVAQIKAILTALSRLIVAVGLDDEPIQYQPVISADLLNAIEQQTLDLYNKLGLNAEQHVADIYAGDNLYTAHFGQYTGVAENFVRGLN